MGRSRHYLNRYRLRPCDGVLVLDELHDGGVGEGLDTEMMDSEDGVLEGVVVFKPLDVEADCLGLMETNVSRVSERLGVASEVVQHFGRPRLRSGLN